MSSPGEKVGAHLRRSDDDDDASPGEEENTATAAAAAAAAALDTREARSVELLEVVGEDDEAGEERGGEEADF